MRILLVEDDDVVSRALTDSMTMHGIAVRRAGTARDAATGMRRDIDAVVLDLGLPDDDGFGVLSRLRREYSVPIIIATARGDLTSRVHGLNLGADDYLVKPFETVELLARLFAVHRRARAGMARPATAGAPPGVLTAGRLMLDVQRHTVTLDGHPVGLTRKEFAVLALLATHPGVVIRREQLTSAVWESSWRGGEHTLNVHMAALRAKLGDRALIETVRGVGYRLGPG